MPKPSYSAPPATVVPEWVHAKLHTLPNAAFDYVRTAGANTLWLQYFLEALGEDAPSVADEAWSDLELYNWTAWIRSPRRWDLARLGALAIGVHARRHGWDGVKQFLYIDCMGVPPPYGAFGGMLSRLMAGANAVDEAALEDTFIVQRTRSALEHLFAGCDLTDMARYVAAWEDFVRGGGLAPGDLPLSPVLFEPIALAGGEVMAIQLGTEAALREVHYSHLWPMVATDQAIAILLDTGQPMNRGAVMVFEPTLEGQWQRTGPEFRSWMTPEIREAIRELGEVMARVDIPGVLRQRAREAAARRDRYSRTGALYSDPQRATPAELAAVGRWFPLEDGDDALRCLRRAWDVAGAHTATA